jgi:tetratricopeptide (TPR) repeat protein
MTEALTPMMTTEKQYERRLEQIDLKLAGSAHPERLDVVARAKCLLCLGRFKEALESYQLAHHLATSELQGSGGYLDWIGAVQWLMGQRAEGMITWRAHCQGLLDDTIQYADLAGGVGPGLLVWYGAVTTGDQEQLSFARRYLRGRSRRSVAKYWPGPIAKLVLGDYSFSQVLVAGELTDNLQKAIKRSRSDVLACRRLINATFYFGVDHRAHGDEDKCMEMLRLCADLNNPEVEVAWYLARGELGLPMHNGP